MSDLEADVRRMYTDIVEYGGDLGDGVNTGGYDPFVIVRNDNLTPFVRTGVAVAVLCRLMYAIDNESWDQAMVRYGPWVRELLAVGALDYEPLVQKAAEAFLVSEAAFNDFVLPVYTGVVRRWISV